MLTIYQIKDLSNGKKYIGMTTQPLKKRLSFHFTRSSKSNSLVAEKYQEYGCRRDMFEVTELAVISNIVNINFLQELEIFYIDYYRTLCSENGYNRTRTEGTPPYRNVGKRTGRCPFCRGFGVYHKHFMDNVVLEYKCDNCKGTGIVVKKKKPYIKKRQLIYN